MNMWKNIIVYQAKKVHPTLVMSTYSQNDSLETCKAARLDWLSGPTERIMHLFEFAYEVPSHLLNQVPETCLSHYDF